MPLYLSCESTKVKMITFKHAAFNQVYVGSTFEKLKEKRTRQVIQQVRHGA